MKRTRKFSPVALLVLLSLGLTTHSKAAFVYLNPDSIDLRSFPLPPEPGSPDDLADLDAVRKLQAARTPEACSRATGEAGASVMSFYGMSHAVLSAAEINLVSALYLDLASDADMFISLLKINDHRPRPFQRDTSITLCVPMVGGFSYPSGHATLARLSARVFGMILPDRAKALLARGDEVGFDRVLGGVHHPRDILAGEFLGEELLSALRRSPEFMRRVESLRSRLFFYEHGRLL